MNRSLLAAALLVVSATVATAQGTAPPLRAAAPDALRGRSYGVTFSQVVAFQGDYHGAEMTRSAQFRVTLSPAAGARGALVVRVDSARGSASNPHAREVLDLRPMMGTSLQATYADSGRPVTWSERGPTVSFGEIGGAIPLTALLDPIFPALPNRAVRASDTWERTWSTFAIVGQKEVQLTVRTRYQVERVETVDRAQVVRVRFTSTPIGGAVAGATSTGTMLVGVDGVLRELRIEETHNGNDWDFNGNTLTYAQRDELVVTLRAPTPNR
jgi:hypothetical protein